METHRKPFENSRIYFDILHGIAKIPPSDNVLDVSIVTMIREFTKTNKTDLETWNFYKEILDKSMVSGMACPTMKVMFDLERFYIAPQGGYSEKLGEDNEFYIAKAPWRQK